MAHPISNKKTSGNNRDQWFLEHPGVPWNVFCWFLFVFPVKILLKIGPRSFIFKLFSTKNFSVFSFNSIKFHLVDFSIFKTSNTRFKSPWFRSDKLLLKSFDNHSSSRLASFSKKTDFEIPTWEKPKSKHLLFTNLVFSQISIRIFLFDLQNL